MKSKTIKLYFIITFAWTWIMHSIGNLSVPLLPILFLEDVPQPGYWVWAIFNVITAIGLSFWVYKRKQDTIGVTL